MPDQIKYVATEFGNIAYTERGEGQPALFVHGVFLNSYLWRSVIEQVADMRHCIAIDLLGHGATQVASNQKDLSWNVQADMIAAFCDALGLGQIDLVGNDSGIGISQIFAARHGSRLCSLTLTDGDVFDNCPPVALQPLVEISKQNQLGELGRKMLANPDFARQILAPGYEHVEQVSEQTLRAYLEPIFSIPERTQLFEQLFNQWFVNTNGSCVVIEPVLKTVQTPTLIVWGTDDVFFDMKWAYWLRDTIPGTREVVMLEGARLFFPEERPDELAKHLRAHWMWADKKQSTKNATGVTD